ncbi:MerR family transcriptional regulator [Nocardioides dubius]|uniref:MerR family transcriptional regulator n=1 Tax=Nocardioides dubius TaxID=317019 RepID=A0ABN1U3I9_9ACTN
MLNIGEFARLTGVSVRMLRHYDQLGLLTPAEVDPFTGYRRYTSAQLARANQLIALKDLGFSLAEVKECLDRGLGSGEFAALLHRRREGLVAQITDDQRRLAAVDEHLRRIHLEETMPTPTYLETDLPALQLTQLSTEVPEADDLDPTMSRLFSELNEIIAATGLPRFGPGVAHYTQRGDSAMLVAAAEQLGDAPAPAGTERFDLPAVPRALTVRYESADLAGIKHAWQSLVTEAEARGHQLSGPCREVYLTTPFDGPGATGWVIDLQQPIR